MSTLNRNFMTFGGEPITGRTPTQIIVHGSGPLSDQQRAMVEHAYKLFCDNVRLSPAASGYHVQNRQLADGTRVRMESNGGLDRVMVWPEGGDDFEILFLASPRFMTDFINGNATGNVVYLYALKKGNQVRIKTPEIFKLKPGVANPLAQQPGNTTWFDSRSVEERETKHILSWWSPHSARCGELGVYDRQLDSGVMTWYGADVTTALEGNRLYLDGELLVNFSNVSGFTTHLFFGAAIFISDDGGKYIRAMLSESSWPNTIKLVQFLVSDAATPAHWTTTTVSQYDAAHDLYILPTRIVGFNSSGTHLAYVAGSFGKMAVIEIAFDGGAVAVTHISERVVSSAINSIPNITLPMPAPTYANTIPGMVAAGIGAACAYDETVSRTWTWNGSRSTSYTTPVAADYSGNDLVVYVSVETYNAVASASGNRWARSWYAASRPSLTTISYDGSGHQLSVNDHSTESYTYSYAIKKIVGVSETVAYAHPATLEMKRDCSVDIGYDYSFDPYVGPDNVPVNDTIDNFNSYHRTYVNGFDKHVSISRFVVLGCDPRFDRLLVGETQWSPLLHGDGQYTQTARISEILSGAVVSTEESDIGFASYFGNSVIPDTSSPPYLDVSSFWTGPLKSGSAGTSSDGWIQTHSESGQAAFESHYVSIPGPYGPYSPTEDSVPIGGVGYNVYANYTVENYTDTQARPVPSFLALSINMFDINTKKGALTISGGSLFGMMGAFGPFGAVVLNLNQNAWMPGYVTSGEFRTARLSNGDLGATISNHSLAGQIFSTKKAALSALADAPVVGRAWLSSPIYIPTWKVPK